LWASLSRRFDLKRRLTLSHTRRAKNRVQLLLTALEERAVMSAGAIDTTFGFGGKGIAAFDAGGLKADTAVAMAIQADGKIVVAGGCDGPNGNRDFAIARFQVDGAPDPNFGVNGKVRFAFDGGGNDNDEAFAVAIQPDGKIVVAGQTDTSVPDIDMAVIRLNTNGSLDDGGANDSTPGDNFNADGKISIFFDLGGSKFDIAKAVAIKGDRIVVAGYAQTGTFNFDMAVAQLDFAGNLDNAFSPGGTDGGSGRTVVAFDLGGLNIDEAHAVAVQGDKILLAGTAHTAADGVDMAIARLDSAGVLDSTFSPGGTEGNGKAIVGFNIGGNDFDSADGMVVQPDGKIVLAGAVAVSATDFDFGVARLLPEGGLDTANFGFGDGKSTAHFDLGGNNDDKARSVAVQKDGKIVVAGTVQVGGAGDYDFGVVRFKTDGALDPTYDADGKATIAFNLGQAGTDKAEAMALDAGGSVIVAGTVQRSSAGDTDFGAARLVPDPPPAPIVLTPSAPKFVNKLNRLITGTATAGSLVRVYKDVNNNNQIDAEDTLVGQKQLGAAAKAYSISVSLTNDAANDFLVTATKLNSESTPADVPTTTDEGIIVKKVLLADGTSVVRVRGATSGQLLRQFGPYPWAVVKNVKDLNGDGVNDVYIFSPQNGRTLLQVFDGRNVNHLLKKKLI